MMKAGLASLSIDELAVTTGGSTVDYSHHSQWVESSTRNLGRYGFKGPFNNKGLRGVRNPDMTNVVLFPS